MSPAEMINDLENRISAARSDAEIFLQECGEVLASMRVSDFGNLPDQFTARRREVSRRFHDPLVRVGALVQRSPMFGNTDLQAVQSAVRRIDAALRLRYLQEWERFWACGPRDFPKRRDSVLVMRSTKSITRSMMSLDASAF